MIHLQALNWHQFLRDLVTAGQEAAASEQVQAAYAADPARLDGFATIGGVYREAKNWLKAHEWMSRDKELGRMSWGWQLRYAEVLLELGQEDAACALVDQVYAVQAEAGDAYARLGWVKARAQDWDAAYALMMEDFEVKRLSPTWHSYTQQIF